MRATEESSGEKETYLADVVHLIALRHQPVPDLLAIAPFAGRVLAESHGGADEHDAQRNAISKAIFLGAPELIPVVPKVDWAGLKCG